MLQFVLMAAIVGAVIAWPDRDSTWRSALGALLFLSGTLVVILAARALGSSMTPFPRPARGGQLVDDGPYAFVRHPVYSGGILVFGGIPLALSPWALVGTGRPGARLGAQGTGRGALPRRLAIPRTRTTALASAFGSSPSSTDFREVGCAAW